MCKKLFFILLFFYSVLGHCLGGMLAPIEPFKRNDRVLILAPHPDDETIGCAGIIQEALSKGAQVKVVYLTNGDHNQVAFIVYEKRLTLRKGEFIHMGEVRRKEAIKAMRLLGLTEKDLIFLGYPDFGTLTIFSQYWQTKKPFRSLLTRISNVPYRGNMSFQAPYKGESILNDLESVLLEYKPNKIFVSHPADTNPDHKALYLFLQIALRDLNKKISDPHVYPYLIHCVGWPIPRHYHPELSLEPPKQFSKSQIKWLEFSLTPEQLNKKYQTILSYKSQTESSAFYLLSFARKNELFGDYPEIELQRQVSVKERALSFFGFSNMFREQDTGVSGGLENLTEDEGRASYAFVDNSILIHIEKTEEINRRFSFMLYLFGYSHKTPFAYMPKISIIAKYNRFRVFNGKSMIEPQGISLQLSSRTLILKVPLKILGSPDFILTSMKAYGRPLPADVTGFRKIDIE
jgi:LmbE family N-acetylglucosaminyl deacetylase